MLIAKVPSPNDNILRLPIDGPHNSARYSHVHPALLPSEVTEKRRTSEEVNERSHPVTVDWPTYRNCDRIRINGEQGAKSEKSKQTLMSGSPSEADAPATQRVISGSTVGLPSEEAANIAGDRGSSFGDAVMEDGEESKSLDGKELEDTDLPGGSALVSVEGATSQSAQPEIGDADMSEEKPSVRRAALNNVAEGEPRSVSGKSPTDHTANGDLGTIAIPSEHRPSLTISETDQPTARPPGGPHMDLGTYPTPELLKILASLLQQIAIANDALRPPPSPMPEDEIMPGGAGNVDGGRAPGGLSSSERLDGVGAGTAQIEADAPRVLSESPSRAGIAASSSRKSSRGSMVDSMVIPPFRPKHGPAAGSVSSGSGQASDWRTPARAGSGHGSGSSSAPQSSTQESSLDSLGVARRSETGPSAPVLANNGSSASSAVSSTLPSNPRSSPTPSTSSSSSGIQFTTTAARKSVMHPSAILCFHARNVPSISIEAYLQRILKYCPITNEVFLSLLIYFDRMSRTHYGDLAAGGDGTGQGRRRSSSDLALRGFAIDSFNVHRLVIAGITVASKFFSDIFYTNSRYAKVGGLPQTELNQLELQFLLLNDFNLRIPLEEMQRYADQLLVYWSNKNGEGPSPARAPSGTTSSPESVVRSESGSGGKRKRPETKDSLAQVAPLVGGSSMGFDGGDNVASEGTGETRVVDENASTTEGMKVDGVEERAGTVSVEDQSKDTQETSRS